MRIYVILVLLLVGPLWVAAHGASFSHEERVGAYLVDIGYDNESPAAGDRIVFDFNLSHADTALPVAFDSVWVRIEQEGEVLLATGLARAEFGPTSLLYTAPLGTTGDLTIQARYQSGDDSLAETSFTLPVAQQPRGRTGYLSLFAGIGGILLGGAFVAIIRRKQVVPR